EFVTEVEVLWGSGAVGKTVREVFTGGGPLLLALVRGEEMIWPPFENVAVSEGDIFILQGNVNDMAAMEGKEGMRILPGLVDGHLRFEPKTMSFVELVVRPDSPCVGCSVRDLGLRRRADLVAMALMRGGRHIRARIADLILRPGDVLLAFGSEEGIREVSEGRDFLLMEGIHETFMNRRRAPIAAGILALVMAALSSGYVPMELATLGGAFLMILTGCITTAQAYRSVNWPILVLIAGTLALGRALETTGTAGLIAEPLVWVGERWGEWAALSALCLAASILTSILSNNATAVLLVPIALTLAASIGVDPRPMLITITFAASAAFATPLGYQTNLIVYGPGGYRFGDFFRIGAPLTLILWVFASFLIPVFWRF
ncbi:MAG: SLC13 family permease, partial [Candidatus Eisenbacteria bacterium]